MARNLRWSWRRWLSQLGPLTGQQTRPRQRRLRLLLEALEERLVPANPYVVTTAADSGTGSLRDAITQINASNALYTTEIDFSITGTGVHTISLLSPLPQVTRAGTYINGLTQGGSGNTTP